MRVKYQQLFSNECGKYAIKNLLYLYKIKYDDSKLFVLPNGLSMWQIKEELNKYFNNVNVISFNVNELKKVEEFKPFILLLKKNDLGHYVVVYKVNKKYLYVIDSLANHSYKIKCSSLNTIDCIFCENTKRNSFKLINIIKVIFFVFLSIIESLLLLSTTILIQQIIDNGLKDALLYFAIQLLLNIITLYKTHEFIKSYKSIDNNFINNNLANIYNLKVEYLKQYKIDEVYYRLYDAYTYKGMYLSFIFNFISDASLAILSFSLLFVYSYVMGFIMLFFASIIILISALLTKRIKETVENRRIKELEFRNYYRDSFTNKNNNNLFNNSLKKIKEFQKIDLFYQKIIIKKDLILVCFQSSITIIFVFIYFSRLYAFLSLGSLIATINLISLILQPVLSMCSQFSNFSNIKLIKQRLLDVEKNVKS